MELFIIILTFTHFMFLLCFDSFIQA